MSCAYIPALFIKILEHNITSSFTCAHPLHQNLRTCLIFELPFLQEVLHLLFVVQVLNVTELVPDLLIWYPLYIYPKNVMPST